MLKKVNVAIDGPAASGKSTVAGRLADKLDYLYLDTGVMYRAVTWAALQRGIDIDDEEAVTELARSLVIEVTEPTDDDGRQYTVLADGQDITWKIREPAVNSNVSPVSAYVGVRRALTEKQRSIGADGGVIMAGRDIGTVVLPDARVKVYLDASLQERARRRYLEMRQRGKDTSMSEVLEGLERRDQIDSTRKAAPLRPADDAILVDSTHMSVAEVVAAIEGAIRHATYRDG
jgi:cytidylate kinase